MADPHKDKETFTPGLEDNRQSSSSEDFEVLHIPEEISVDSTDADFTSIEPPVSDIVLTINSQQKMDETNSATGGQSSDVSVSATFSIDNQESTTVSSGEVSVGKHSDGLDKTEDSRTLDKGEESADGQVNRPSAVAGSGYTDTRALAVACSTGTSKGKDTADCQLDRPAAVSGSGDTNSRDLAETCGTDTKVQDSWVKNIQLRKIDPQWVLFYCGTRVKIPHKIATDSSTKLTVESTGEVFIANDNDVYEVKKTNGNRIVFCGLDSAEFSEENKSDTGDKESDQGSMQFNSQKQMNTVTSVEFEQELTVNAHEKPSFTTNSATSIKEDRLCECFDGIDTTKHAEIADKNIPREQTSDSVNMQPPFESSMDHQPDKTIPKSKLEDFSRMATMSDTGLNQNTSLLGETLPDQSSESAVSVEKIAIAPTCSDKLEVLGDQKTEVMEVDTDQIGTSELKNEIDSEDQRNGIGTESEMKETGFPASDINTEATRHAGENVCGDEATEDALPETTGDVTPGKHTIPNESDNAVKRQKLQAEKDDTGGRGTSDGSKVGNAVAENAVTDTKAQVCVVIKCERRLPGVADFTICDINVKRDLDMDSYMKWQFVVNSPLLRSAAAGNIKASRGFQLSMSPNGVCTVMIGKVEKTPDEKPIVNLVAENIFNVASAIAVLAFPCTGVNAEDIVNNIMKSEIRTRHHVYAEVDKDPQSYLVSLAYDTRYSTRRTIGNVIKTATKQAQQQKEDSLKTANAVDRNVMDKEVLIENPAIYENIFSEEEFKSKFPHIASDMTCTKDRFVIKMKGQKHDVDSAGNFIEKRKSEFTGNEVSITDIKHFDPSKHSFTKLREIFDSAYKEITMKNCFWSLEDSNKKVYILAAEQKDADTLTNCFKKSLASIEIDKSKKSDEFVACYREAQKSGNLLESNVVGNAIHINIVGSRDIVLKLKHTLEKAAEARKTQASPSSISTQKAAADKTKSVSRPTGGPLVASTGQGQQNTKVTEVPMDEDALMYLVNIGKLEMIRKRFSVVVKPKQDGKGLEIGGAADPVRNATKAIEYMADTVKSVIINYSAIDEEFFKSTDGSAILHTLERDCSVITEVMNSPGQDVSGDLAGLPDGQHSPSSWTFPDGHVVTVQLGDLENCWEDLMVENIEMKDGPEDLSDPKVHEIKNGKKMIKLQVPKHDQNKAKDVFQRSLKGVLECAKIHDHTEVCISLDDRCGWPVRKFNVQIFTAVTEHLSQPDRIPATFTIFTEVAKGYLEACRECATALVKCGINPEEAQKQPQTGKKPKPLHTVAIVKGSLENIQADVIVNTTGYQLKLDTGFVSNKLLNKAGSKLQNECNRKCPKGIHYGEIIHTAGYCLNCHHVLHGALDGYHDKASLQKLQRFVIDCMRKMVALKHRTIAFPAIGTGNLKFPKDKVAVIMYRAVDEFLSSYAGSDPLDIKFVLWAGDTETVKAFEDADNKRAKGKLERVAPLAGFTKDLFVGGVTISAELGSLDMVKAQSIIYLWDRQNMHSVSFSGHPLLKHLGPEQAHFRNHRNDKEKRSEVLTTGGGQLQFIQKVVHVPCDDSPTDFIRAFKDGLLAADKAGMISAVVLFPANHPLLKHGDKLAHALIEAAKDVSPAQFSTLTDVCLMIEGNLNFSKVKAYMDSYLDKCGVPPPPLTAGSKVKVSTGKVAVKVIGLKGNVEEANRELTRQLDTRKLTETPRAPSPEQAPITSAPPDQTMYRGAEGGASGNSLTGPGDIGAADMNGSHDETTIDQYVVVDNIEPGITDAQLKTDLLTSDFPIRPPTFVYPGGAQALLICQSKKDAAEVTSHFAKKVQQRYTIGKLKPDVLKNFRTTLNLKIVAAARQKGILNDLVKKLQAIHVNVSKEINRDNTELITNTSLQLQKSMQIIEEFAANELQLKRQKTISDCVDIDSVTCSSIAWGVCQIVKKSLLGKIKKENISVSYIDGKILIDRTGPESIPDNVRQLVTELKEFLGNEFEEIPVDGSRQDADRWCSEIEQFVGTKCCIYAPEQNAVIAYSDQYDRIQLVKHQLNIKQGKVKQTGRGRHQRALVASDDQLRALAKQKSTPSVGQQHTELEPRNSTSAFNWKYDADNVETYQTAEGITIKVYVANILKLHVDCIVNAANRSLQHGGGVARVIADAAGYQLTQECNTYVRTNGDVPVGMAYVSTAGRLSYRCVIHTVGPCWYDYRPHSLKDVQTCEADLYNAILNSFLKAEGEGLKSIALPAVSSAIFGVPQEICAYQYANATMDYSKKSVTARNPLQEIHFIDKNEDIVRKIQQSFTDMFRLRKFDCPYNKQGYAGQKQRGHSPFRYSADYGGTTTYNTGTDTWQKQRHHSPVKHPTTQSKFYTGSDNMGTTTYTGAASTQSYSKKNSNKNTEPISYEDKSTGGYIFHMIGNANQELRLYVGDILHARVPAIACSDDSHGSGQGFIARKLAEYGKTCPYETDKKNKFWKGKKTNEGDVVVTAGYGNFKKIFHAILPSHVTDLASATVKPILKKAYSNILQECVNEKLSSIAMSLLATGRGDKLMTSVQAFQESYTTFCKKMKDKPHRLSVHLVCHEPDKFLAVNKALYTYVKERSKKSSFPPPRPPLPLPSPSAEGKFQPLAPPTGYSPAHSPTTGHSSPTHPLKVNYPPALPSPHTVGIDKESAGNKPTDDDSKDDNCVICMDTITDPKSLKCGHKFCRECIDESFKHKKVCPMCGAVCGIITGDQPPGTIQVHLAQHQHCMGYESVGQLQITYNFPSGHQGGEHPSPGQRYRGIARTGYLPNNKKGQLICEMLRIAFDRRLVFTIGDSRTTGQKGVITWNDIHHKTDPTPHTQFGYPDPSYLDRVIDELSAKGVTEADVPESSHM